MSTCQGCASRQLWLIRHARTADPGPGQRDIDRQLTARGKQDCSNARARLARCTDAPAWIWVSPAVRARDTAALIAADTNACTVEEDSLYLAGPEALLEVIRGTPDDITHVALVAHNPGLTVLTNLLAGQFVTDNLPPLGIARFCTEQPWHEVAPQHLRLLEVTQ